MDEPEKEIESNYSVDNVTKTFMQMFQKVPDTESFIFVVEIHEQQPINIRISRDVIHMKQDKDNGKTLDLKYIIKNGHFSGKDLPEEKRVSFLQKVQQLYGQVSDPDGDGELFVEKRKTRNE
ncbi:hypothetical protein DID80_04135 [Candidatus Marinamargulisbacteria bacterium SCGC AAA071-K20]|nr:hypothetical protein DID80_04135 [Candidatus Marinamargulisbacteria bacterium SCGC AAA071-K20]